MRKKLTKSGSKSLFRTTAMKTHKANLRPEPMRGGYRM